MELKQLGKRLCLVSAVSICRLCTFTLAHNCEKLHSSFRPQTRFWQRLVSKKKFSQRSWGRWSVFESFHNWKVFIFWKFSYFKSFHRGALAGGPSLKHLFSRLNFQHLQPYRPAAAQIHLVKKFLKISQLFLIVFCVIRERIRMKTDVLCFMLLPNLSFKNWQWDFF